jgi:hypothetical protein
MQLLVIVALITVAVCVYLVRVNTRRIDPENLGRVSDQWLAEYRASHASW